MSITKEEAAALTSDELLTYALDQLAILRRAASRIGSGKGTINALEDLDTCVPLLDVIVSRRFGEDWEAARFTHALDYVKRAGVGGAQLLQAEIGIITHLHAERVKALHLSAKKNLQRLARDPRGSLSVSRPGDLSRHWFGNSGGARQFIARLVERDGESYRLSGTDSETQKKIVNLIDAFIVLLSNNMEVVPLHEYRLSVSIAAGTLP